MKQSTATWADRWKQAISEALAYHYHEVLAEVIEVIEKEIEWRRNELESVKQFAYVREAASARLDEARHILELIKPLSTKVHLPDGD